MSTPTASLLSQEADSPLLTPCLVVWPQISLMAALVPGLNTHKKALFPSSPADQPRELNWHAMGRGHWQKHLVKGKCIITSIRSPDQHCCLLKPHHLKKKKKIKRRKPTAVLEITIFISIQTLNLEQAGKQQPSSPKGFKEPSILPIQLHIIKSSMTLQLKKPKKLKKLVCYRRQKEPANTKINFSMQEWSIGI